MKTRGTRAFGVRAGLLACITILGMTACITEARAEESAAEDTEAAMNRAGAATERGIGKAGDATGKALGKAVEATGRGASWLVEKTGEGLDRAGQAMQHAGDKLDRAPASDEKRDEAASPAEDDGE